MIYSSIQWKVAYNSVYKFVEKNLKKYTHFILKSRIC